MTHTDTHATPTRTLLSCPVCGAREQLSRPYLPDEALHGRQIVPYSIMRHAILQYFAWHPSYTTAFMITVWLEGTDSEVWCNPALLRRIQRTLREMVAADDVRRATQTETRSTSCTIASGCPRSDRCAPANPSLRSSNERADVHARYADLPSMVWDRSRMSTPIPTTASRSATGTE
jgi:hypothetical protein